ncbi:apolipo L3-like protein [Labeo rohita]|uniref:Apolipo L3-like protein n=1 Tax=Labeo rohita TaxID=84645 RepID=A0A498NKI9_LABRO|nr:apolipo L3-like protein [Labeo rohita]
MLASLPCIDVFSEFSLSKMSTRKLKVFNDELKKLIKELNSDFDKNHPTLTDQIKKVQNITDELKSIHKKTTEGSLTGAALGAAGGITSTAGLCLAPFTFGASLALTGVGAAAGIVGGATGATCTITNMVKHKTLRETIEKIINDVQNTINAMIKQMREIYDNIEETEQLEQTMEKEGVTTARGATDTSELKNEIGKVSALAVKDMLVFVQAANVTSACVDAADAAYVAARAAKFARVSTNAAKATRVSADVAKAARASADAAKFAGIATGILSAVFVVFGVVSVVQHATELSEINQPTETKKISNQTL